MPALICCATAFPVFSQSQETGSGSAFETLRGQMADPGVGCPRFELPTGEQISLMGNVPDIAVGRGAELTGRWARVSTCMQGRAFLISASVTMD